MRFLVLSIITLSFFLISNQAISSERITKQINSSWEFAFDDQNLDAPALDKLEFKQVNIPHTWNDKDIQSGEKVNYGTAWYRKELDIEDKMFDGQVYLKFEGVGQYAKIFVNDQFVGEHLGAYSAFSYNITRFLAKGKKNILKVRVNNELTNSYPKDNFLFGIFGGIYRDVQMIYVPHHHISLNDRATNGIYIHQTSVSKEYATLEVETKITNENRKYAEVDVKTTLFDAEGNEVNSSIKTIQLSHGGNHTAKNGLRINNPRLWNGRKDPYLYTVKSEIFINDKCVDEVTEKIGIRTFKVDKEKGFILNGEPYRLYGVCRHQEWEDLGSALLPKHHREDMLMIYDVGATTVRLAHYQQAEYVYDLADSLGILVWAEIPFVNGYKEGANDNAKQQLIELIKQNFNHPSIFVWGLHNEVIKGKVVEEPVQLTKELYWLAQKYDTSRYTVAVSNIWWVFDHDAHEITDLQGFNQYSGWYGGHPSGLEKWIKNYRSKKPDVCFSISEYGAGGNIYQQTLNIDSIPHPKGKFFPETYHTYYHEVTWAGIEKHEYIWASYIWNMFDFSVPEWDRGGIKGRNHKGLVTYDRQTKKDSYFWYKANWSEEPVLFLPEKRNDSLNVDTLTIKAYCNFGTPELIVNGKSMGSMAAGINKVQFIMEGIVLKEGPNKIEIRAKSTSGVITDTREIILIK